MIETLRIKNLVLIEECFIDFNKGLTIITGETGAGKTALTQALYLIRGERADSSLVRKGKDKAYVEGLFNIEGQKEIFTLLEDLGIEYHFDEPLILSRELSKEGRSRAFINKEAVPLSVLQKVSESLISLISQHSYHELKNHETMRDVVDTYGSLEGNLNDYKECYRAEAQAKKTLLSLEEQLQDRERNFERYSEDLEEITSCNLKKEEEEELFARFGLMSKAKQIQSLLDEMRKGLSGQGRSILKELLSFRTSCEQLTPYCQDFSQLSELLQEAIIALQEADHTMTKIGASIDCDNMSIEKVEERLHVYSRIKKKYGPSYEDWMSHKDMLEEILNRYSLLDEENERCEKQHISSQKALDESAKRLSDARACAAKDLAQKLSLSLQELNMPGASLEIKTELQPRGPYGDDLITFWLCANKGEKPSSIRDSTSGGELSRLLLAIKTILAEKNNTSTIVFDEIDANVGGTTAALIGEKLKELSNYRQVFCITHFAQVAKKGDMHIRICKKEKEARTVAVIETLGKEGRELELLRMVGDDRDLLLVSKKNS